MEWENFVAKEIELTEAFAEVRQALLKVTKDNIKDKPISSTLLENILDSLHYLTSI